MTDYYVKFINKLDDVWTMGVYQELPDSVGLKSVSWKQTTVPSNGISTVQWKINYLVCLGNYQQVGGVGVYDSSQTLSTDLGSAWKVVWEKQVQQLQPDSDTKAPSDSIIISNTSGFEATVGIGMDDSASVYSPNVKSGLKAQFMVTPTYYVGLFSDLILGEVISSNITIGPKEIQFPEGRNLAIVTAEQTKDKVNLDITYGNRATFSLDDVERTIKLQGLRRLALPAPTHAELETTASHNGA